MGCLHRLLKDGVILNHESMQCLEFTYLKQLVLLLIASSNNSKLVVGNMHRQLDQFTTRKCTPSGRANKVSLRNDI